MYLWEGASLYSVCSLATPLVLPPPIPGLIELTLKFVCVFEKLLVIIRAETCLEISKKNVISQLEADTQPHIQTEPSRLATMSTNINLNTQLLSH